MSEETIHPIGELEEKEKAKKVQIPYESFFQYNNNIDYATSPSLKKNTSYQSSLQKTKKPNALFEKNFQTRPDLFEFLPDKKPFQETNLQKFTSQETVLGYEIAKAIKNNEAVLQNVINIILDNIKVQNENIIQLSKEDEKNLEKLLDQLKKQENSNILKSMLNITSSAIAITIGTILLTTQPASIVAASAAFSSLYASFMIVTGISNLVINEFMPRFQGFEKIAGFFTSEKSKQQNLADNIKHNASLANGIMAVISSIASISSIETIFNNINGFDIANLAVQLASGANDAYQDINKNSYTMLQAKHTEIEGRKNQTQSKLDKSYTNLHSSCDLQTSFYKLCYKIFEAIQKITENNIK